MIKGGGRKAPALFNIDFGCRLNAPSFSAFLISLSFPVSMSVNVRAETSAAFVSVTRLTGMSSGIGSGRTPMARRILRPFQGNGSRVAVRDKFQVPAAEPSMASTVYGNDRPISIRRMTGSGRSGHSSADQSMAGVGSTAVVPEVSARGPL